MLKKEYEDLEKMLKSFVSLELVKQANYNEENKYISLVLNDDTIVNYLNIPLEQKLIDAYRTNCHAVSSDFLRRCDVTNNIAVVLEDNELYGKYYYSFVLQDDVVYDLSHKLVISYESYLKLIKPIVLIKKDRATFLKEILKLEETDKSYSKSKYVDVLKYAMDTNSNKNKVKTKSGLKRWV